MSKNSNIKYIIILIVLLLALGTLAFFLFKTQEEKKEIELLMDYEKEKLELEFAEWSIQNEDFTLNIGNDSLLNLLNQEREKIQYLLERIKVLEAGDMGEFHEIRQELDATRDAARHYIAQVDSLSTLNRNLQTENNRIRKRNQEIEELLKKLTEENKSSTEKVTQAAIMEATDIRVDGMSLNSGKTTTLSRIETFQCCFRLVRNRLATVGKKDVYLRFTAPDGTLFESTVFGSPTFKFENKDIPFSARKTIEYGGEDMEVCLLWKSMPNMKSGTYRVAIFLDGFLIGEKEVNL